MLKNEVYALKVPIEQNLLPKLGNHSHIEIPAPIKISKPSHTIDYPHKFSIYKWVDGKSANHLHIDDKSMESMSLQLANFLKELQSINDIDGPNSGQHNWWRGDHISGHDEKCQRINH